MIFNHFQGSRDLTFIWWVGGCQKTTLDVNFSFHIYAETNVLESQKN